MVTALRGCGTCLEGSGDARGGRPPSWSLLYGDASAAAVADLGEKTKQWFLHNACGLCLGGRLEELRKRQRGLGRPQGCGGDAFLWKL